MSGLRRLQAVNSSGGDRMTDTPGMRASAISTGAAREQTFFGLTPVPHTACAGMAVLHAEYKLLFSARRCFIRYNRSIVSDDLNTLTVAE